MIWAGIALLGGALVMSNLAETHSFTYQQRHDRRELAGVLLGVGIFCVILGGLTYGS